MTRCVRLACAVWLSLGLLGCSSAPPAPDWQVNAHGAMQRATVADLEGNERVAQVEWRRAIEETRRTARPDWLARVELSRCAIRQAGLDVSDCVGFDRLRADAPPDLLAYARYLAGAPEAADLAALPAPHRPAAQWLLAPASGAGSTTVLAAMPDPVSRLVAASALLRAGRLDSAGVAVAVDTASAQGWRRPLLAWLRVQADVARQVGNVALAEQAERRIELLTAGAAARPAPTSD
jgi:hypothetical protein